MAISILGTIFLKNRLFFFLYFQTTFTPITKMELGFKTYALIAVIFSILMVYMIFSSTSIGFRRNLISSSFVETSCATNETEVELPPITRKSAPWVLNIYHFRVPYKYLYDRKFNISALFLINRTDYFLCDRGSYKVLFVKLTYFTK